MSQFNVLITGRSNVGKSTLFNRLLNGTKSITNNNPGTTRDYKSYEFYLNNLPVKLYDTAGCDLISPNNFLQKEIMLLNEKLIINSDLILFVVDSKIGLTNNDIEFANYLRKFHSKTFLISNKHDNKKSLQSFWEPLSLGIECSFPISAFHGLGIEDLKKGISFFLNSKSLNSQDDEKNVFFKKNQRKSKVSDPYLSEIHADELNSDNELVKLAIVGRPNVGKSTLLNTITNEDRVLTSSKSGTTTDPILVNLNWLGENFKIIDTAGMRRPSKITKGLEELSVDKSIEVIKFSEVVIMLLDTENALDTQDLKIINLIEKAPFAGVLEDNTSEIGSFLNIGSLCATIIDLSQIKLIGYIPELKIREISLGSVASGKTLSGLSTIGRVSFISRQADPITKTFRVEILAENEDELIRDGETIEIKINLDSNKVHLLPQSVLTLNDVGELGVRTVINKKVEFFKIKILRDQTNGLLVKGLPKTVDVITVGQEFVINGQEVNISYE